MLRQALRVPAAAGRNASAVFSKPDLARSSWLLPGCQLVPTRKLRRPICSNHQKSDQIYLIADRPEEQASASASSVIEADVAVADGSAPSLLTSIEATAELAEPADQTAAVQQEEPVPVPKKKKKKKKLEEEQVLVVEEPEAPKPQPESDFPISQAMIGAVLLAGAGLFLLRGKAKSFLPSKAEGEAPTLPTMPSLNTGQATQSAPQQKKLQKEAQQRLNEFSDQLRSAQTVDLSAKNLGDEGTAYVVEALAFNNTCVAADLSKNGIAAMGIAALCEVLNTSAVQTLSLSTNSVGDQGAELLAKMLAANRTITALDLSQNGIGDKGAAALAEALKLNSTLTRLDLSGNAIDVEGAKALAAALKENRGLQFFAIGDNYLGAEGCQALAEGMSSNVFLQELYIKGNELGDEGVAALCAQLRKRECKTTALDLGNNGVGREGSEQLAGLLAEKPYFRDLNLYMNDIGDQGVIKLAKSLRDNKDLKTLDVGGNNIGPEGMKALAAGIKGHETLTSLELGYNPLTAAGVKALVEVAKYDLPKVETLKMGWCKVGGDDGAKAMADLVMYNRTLQLVDLRGNGMGNNGAIFLARALRQHENPNLRELDLGYNEMKDEGACALAQALKANPEGAVAELKLNSNYVTRFGQVALSEAVDMIYEMGGGKMTTIHY